MKKKQSLKRNTLAVRLNDADHENFLSAAGDVYSSTLREIVNTFSEHHRPEDDKLSTANKVKVILGRVT